jgi:hypothetical protein
MEQRQVVRNNGIKPGIMRKGQEPVESNSSGVAQLRQSKLNSGLWRAVINRNEGKVIRLISEGADVSAKAGDGTTALMEAAKYGCAGICALLMDACTKAGGNIKELITADDKNGWTPLHWAAEHGKTRACVRIVMGYAKAGGNVNELINLWGRGDGWTPIMLAEKYAAETGQALKSIGWLDYKIGNSFILSFSDCISQ